MSSSPDYPFYPTTRKAGECPFGPTREIAAMQAEAPVTQVRIWDESTPWLVTGYDELRATMSDPRILVDAGLPGMPHFSAGDAARRKQARRPLNALDGDGHMRLRRILIPEFAVKRCEARRPAIQELTDGLIDRVLAGSKPVDLVPALSMALPSMVISEILGVPQELRERFFHLAGTLVDMTATREQVLAADQGLTDLFEDLIEIKTQTPGDDVVSRLVHNYLLTERAGRDEIIGLFIQILVAGHDTTASMISLGIAALLQDPATVARLSASPDSRTVARTVEELLRYINPVNVGRRRVAAADMTVGPVDVKAGEGVICALEIADRDPRVIEAPDILDIDRDPNHHLAFAFGPHQCLGQHLARVELQVVFGTLFRRIPTLRLAVPLEELPFREERLAHTLEALPVIW
jgi:cytochrome P450